MRHGRSLIGCILKGGLLFEPASLIAAGWLADVDVEPLRVRTGLLARFWLY